MPAQNWQPGQRRAAHLRPRRRLRLRARRPEESATSSTSPTPRLYRSTDGGKSFTAIKGAPGGDDYHTIWINPDNPDIILLAADQGATISVNGGETWSSWYNQPTAQFYHVITDNQFPYWVYGGQQESGSVGIASRGNYGEITFRDWHPVGVEEYGYVAPDPLNPNIIYGGKVTRYNQATGEVQNVAAARQNYRFVRTAPLLFSPRRSARALPRLADGAEDDQRRRRRWEAISPDLSRETYATARQRGGVSRRARSARPRAAA